MESLQLAGDLLAVRCFRGGYLQKHRKIQCRPELSEQCRHKTDAMDASARMRACVSAYVSGRKKFFFSYSLQQCFVAHCWKKKKFLGLKKLDSCSFWGTSAVINWGKFGDMQGFTCKIARHPTFLWKLELLFWKRQNRHQMKLFSSYWMRLSRIWRMMQIEVNNTLWDLSISH